jgi:hypothetical protein
LPPLFGLTSTSRGLVALLIVFKPAMRVAPLLERAFARLLDTESDAAEDSDQEPDADMHSDPATLSTSGMDNEAVVVFAYLAMFMLDVECCRLEPPPPPPPLPLKTARFGADLAFCGELRILLLIKQVLLAFTGRTINTEERCSLLDGLLFVVVSLVLDAPIRVTLCCLFSECLCAPIE